MEGVVIEGVASGVVGRLIEGIIGVVQQSEDGWQWPDGTDVLWPDGTQVLTEN